jgi:hypothetical protein
MLRHLTPYLALAAVIAGIGAVAYAVGATGSIAVYAAGLLATLIAGAGYARWDNQRHPQP